MYNLKGGGKWSDVVGQEVSAAGYTVPSRYGVQCQVNTINDNLTMSVEYITG